MVTLRWAIYNGSNASFASILGIATRLRCYAVISQDLSNGARKGFCLRSFKYQERHYFIPEKQRQRYRLRMDLSGRIGVMNIYVEPDAVRIRIGHA